MTTSLTPLTVPEARAILIADEALQLSFEQRSEQGPTMNLEEGAAWINLVASAHDRIAVYEGTKQQDSAFEVKFYPGGNAPDFQTLFCEAMASDPEKRGKP